MVNPTLNSRAAAEAGIAGEFKLENFTYKSASILNALSGHLNNTDFLGITVRPIQPELFDCNTAVFSLIIDELEVVVSHYIYVPLHRGEFLLTKMEYEVAEDSLSTK